MDPKLRSILVCPACHGELADGEHEGSPELICARCHRAYPVRDGIPVLLIDEARVAS